MNFFDFSDEDLENLDNNEIFQLSLKSIEEFSFDKILLFINDAVLRTEIIIEGFTEATVMSPSDTLAFRNLCRCSESLTLVEHWIKTNLQTQEMNEILDNSNDDL
jgi:hypothetical protein